MLRGLNVFVLVGCAWLWACDDGAGAALDEDAGGSTGDDGFGESEEPVGAGNGGDPARDAGPSMDAGKPMDAATAIDAGRTVDAGKRVDAASMPYDDDCEELFVFDPTGLSGVTSVVLTGDYSRWTSWVPTASSGAIAMTLGSDGKYSVRVPLDQETFRYKFVVNGDSSAPIWLQDTANCHDADDNFGGRNSVRYACQVAPSCPDPLPVDAGMDVDAGTEEDAGADADAGGSQDAGDLDDAGEPAPDAGDLDASVDAGLDGSVDGGVAMDADVGEAGAGDAGAAGDAGTDSGADTVDVELGDDCVEVFEVDPGKYPEFAPIVSVELRGEAPLSYEQAVIVLREDADGMFRASARIDQVAFKYNVVLNGKDYVRDRDYCPSADDGFGGRGASLRSACQTPACCDIAIAWDPASSGCADVQSAAFVGQLQSWQKPGAPMTLGEDGKFRINFRDAPGSYEYKIIVNDAYVSAPDDNCADNAEAALVVKACVP